MTHFSFKFQNIIFLKYNCISKIFSKINFKFYSNFTTHQTYIYIYICLVIPLQHILFLVTNITISIRNPQN